LSRKKASWLTATHAGSRDTEWRQLTVRDSQFAVFVNEGKVADSFRPGLYTLNTETLPILTYLKNWDKAFKSPFKSDVYFFSARIQTDQHWGTQNPITFATRNSALSAFAASAFIPIT